MVLPDAEGPWPVPVSYAWSGGADLRARTVDAGGDTVRDAVAVSNRALTRQPWGDLPTRDPPATGLSTGSTGRATIVSRGEPRPGGIAGARRWRQRAARHTVRAYLLAEPRRRRAGHPVLVLLSVQRVDQPPRRGLGTRQRDPERLPRRVPRTRVGLSSRRVRVLLSWLAAGCARRPGGSRRPAPGRLRRGAGEFLWWSGRQSGGSYPWPAAYPGIDRLLGSFGPADDTREPGHYLPADSFDVVLLPEPSRLDARVQAGALLAQASVFCRTAADVSQSAAGGPLRRRAHTPPAGAPPGLERNPNPAAVARFLRGSRPARSTLRLSRDRRGACSWGRGGLAVAGPWRRCRSSPAAWNFLAASSGRRPCRCAPR